MIIDSDYPDFIKKIFLDDNKIILRVFLYIFIIYPIKFIAFIFSLFISKSEEDKTS